ncbi:hypothetical protein UFOVP1313_8 [uncultured Caudovirales phage]|uniref:Uncharacterized protein n=1 Tax=uncultured Caudovirales phage TaxID=2100421 RepID=A0A6J5RUX0_9CAUD|nr:hypothetical protein UFOVP1313_8 [uncultured Caudovirales phage]
MPRTFDLAIDVLGAKQTAAELKAAGLRMKDASPAFAAIVPVLEKGEEAHFKRLKGRYVRTGDTMRSLTGEGADGIRDIHNDGAGLTFGTHVWYAKFLTKSPRDPEDSQFKKKGKPGWSAVLVMTPKTRKTVNEILRAWIAGESTNPTTRVSGGFGTGGMGW